MCLGLPGRVMEKNDFSAVVDIGGTKREVSLMMMPEEVDVGEYVMVHVGFAISKMDPEEARKTLETLMDIADEIDG
jgi:hydrogenase expression/formation protein HypC